MDHPTVRSPNHDGRTPTDLAEEKASGHMLIGADGLPKKKGWPMQMDEKGEMTFIEIPEVNIS